MFPVVTYESPGKVTNERTSEYNIYIALKFPAVTISKPKQNWADQWACS
jgi:hypothetical protein